MKFPTDDSDREKVVIIGAKGENAVTAVAKVYSVVRNISAHHMQQLKYWLKSLTNTWRVAHAMMFCCLARSMRSDLRNSAG